MLAGIGTPQQKLPSKPRTGRRPNLPGESLPVRQAIPRDDSLHPKVSLQYVLSDFSVKNTKLSRDQRASLAMRLEEICALDWSTIMRTGKHKQGCEYIPTKQMRFDLPRKFSDSEKVMVFRYDGRLPMVGVRVDDTFYVLAVSPQFGKLYDHGS